MSPEEVLLHRKLLPMPEACPGLNRWRTKKGWGCWLCLRCCCEPLTACLLRCLISVLFGNSMVASSADPKSMFTVWRMSTRHVGLSLGVSTGHPILSQKQGEIILQMT